MKNITPEPDWRLLELLADRAAHAYETGQLSPNTFDELFRAAGVAAGGSTAALELLLCFAPRGWRPPEVTAPERRASGFALFARLKTAGRRSGGAPSPKLDATSPARSQG